MAIPQHQFDENISSPGGGLNVSAVYGIDDSPLGLGLDYWLSPFGTDTPTLASDSDRVVFQFQN